MNISLDLAEDTRDAKFDLIFELASRADLLPPVYIISHKRAGAVTTLDTIPLLREHAWLVVAEAEEREYVREYGSEMVLTIPDVYGPKLIGVGRARQFCLDTSDAVKGSDRVIVMDDDMFSLNVLYGIGGGRVSRAFTQAVGGRRADFHLGVLLLLAAVGDEAFDEALLACVASPQNQNANRTPWASKTRWQLNNGGNPGLLQYWDVQRFLDLTGGIDLNRWNDHGDDIGAVMQILNAGGSVVKVPSIIGDSLDCETRSVIRTPATAAGLRQTEHDHLMADPLARYVKTKLDILDQPQWHSVDWRAMARDGKISQHRVGWVPEIF